MYTSPQQIRETKVQILISLNSKVFVTRIIQRVPQEELVEDRKNVSLNGNVKVGVNVFQTVHDIEGALT